MDIHKKYILSREGLNFEETYNNFNTTFLSKHNSGEIGKNIRVIFDFGKVTLYLFPLYNGSRKYLDSNLSLFADLQNENIIKQTEKEIESKGFKLEKI